MCPGLLHKKERHTDAPVGDIPAVLGLCSFTVSAAATIGKVPHGHAWSVEGVPVLFSCHYERKTRN
jgi:hypothetical protein